MSETKLIPGKKYQLDLGGNTGTFVRTEYNEREDGDSVVFSNIEYSDFGKQIIKTRPSLKYIEEPNGEVIIGLDPEEFKNIDLEFPEVKE